MADCPSLSGCPFFNDHMAARPATADMMKATYCRGDNSRCARWIVCKALGKAMVPKDLFPNQADRARDLVARGSAIAARA